MRLIGNKIKILPEIQALLVDRGIRSGTFIDVFSGSASVSRHFKARGFRVLANDLLSSCYAQARAALEVSSCPPFTRLLRAHRPLVSSRAFRNSLKHVFDRGSRLDPQSVDDFLQGKAIRNDKRRRIEDARLPLRIVLHLLNEALDPREGLIYRNYCPGGPGGRRYFSDENGRRIDAVLEFLRQGRRQGLLEPSEFFLLLSALLNAADRRANISGTYGAYLKSWQRNAKEPLRLDEPEIVASQVSGHRAFQEDSNSLIRRVQGDILYIDPPYNHRQYGANYHVLEIISEYHRIEDLDSYESRLYGKTGLRPYADLHSAYCVPVGSKSTKRFRALPAGILQAESASGDRPRFENVRDALEDLILSARVRHVVVSYNEEGLLEREAIGAILARFAGKRRFDFKSGFTEIQHRRFRSDRDREAEEEGGRVRRYRVLDGKQRDQIGEWLFIATRES
jgi:adenine-specific DNA-methyltransferase